MATTEKAHKGSQAKQWKRKAKGGGKKSCKVAGCMRAYRAKGYCFFHYQAWRRGELGKARYDICNQPECKVKQFKAGLCEKHFNETYKKAAA